MLGNGKTMVSKSELAKLKARVNKKRAIEKRNAEYKKYKEELEQNTLIGFMKKNIPKGAKSILKDVKKLAKKI